MNVTSFTDVASFVRHAAPLLLASEAMNNLILGLCAELAHDSQIYGVEPPLMRTVEADGVAVAAALRTPPHLLIVSWTERLDALDALAASLAAESHVLPGVTGPRSAAERFAGSWSAQTGAFTVVSRSLRVYALTAVRPPAPVPGTLRRAAEADRPLLEAWFDAFHHESERDGSLSNAPAVVERWLTSPQRYLALWDDGGPVSMAGATGPTPNGIRIGAVYTPPERRRRGYASALVAALSQGRLDAGRRFCFLFTDLSNPTSNHIYQELGYEPVVDVAEIRFRHP